MLQTILILTVAASTLVTFVLLCLPSQYRSDGAKHEPPKAGDSAGAKDVSVQVLVLGDLGRSPRMQYHAMSIAKHGGFVQLIGYEGMNPNEFSLFLEIKLWRS